MNQNFWYFLIAVLIAGVIGMVGYGFGNMDKYDLETQIQKLQVENQALQHNLDIANTQTNNDDVSPELETLNSIGQAISDSKKTEIRIETKEGTFINFTYEAK
jgi:uncharacterized protein HemX